MADILTKKQKGKNNQDVYVDSSGGAQAIRGVDFAGIGKEAGETANQWGSQIGQFAQDAQQVLGIGQQQTAQSLRQDAPQMTPEQIAQQHAAEDEELLGLEMMVQSAKSVQSTLPQEKLIRLQQLKNNKALRSQPQKLISPLDQNPLRQ